jgi:serine/threonine protein kinase
VLVDLGLVSSLGSAMTLTTHGTEYFRDPEMVRRALRGVRVMDVDGVRFDVYSAGAVLYAMVENSFPAQAELSPITRRCPASLAWIIKRAMAPYDQRYASASAMLEDVRALAAKSDLFGAKPASLPSMRALASDDDGTTAS